MSASAVLKLPEVEKPTDEAQGPEPSPTEAELPFQGYRFSTGHRVVFLRAGEREEVQLRAPEGDVQLRIVLTPEGPVIRLSHASLEIEALDTVRTRCQRFEVDARESVQVHAGQALALHSDKDMHLNATGEIVAVSELIRLN